MAMTSSDRLMLGAAVGDCVHVAGVLNFLALARRHGWRTEFLGPAVPVERLVDEAERRRPDMLAVSYRLTPEAAERLFAELGQALRSRGLDIPLVFGGPPPVAEAAERSGIFCAVFGAVDASVVERWLSGRTGEEESAVGPDDLVERWRRARPRPLIRHHFGLPDLQRTIAGIEEIARSGVVDVISLGIDQNAQEHFFHPERMDPSQDGAGGVPVRTPDDLRALKEASRVGNHPLMRCYSGTNDLIAMAEMLRDTIGNAWCAVPVFWYSELDGRSARSLEEATSENQQLVAWHGERGVPVERNDQNQWGLRAASDAVQVAAAALGAALSARAGVETYVLQMMLNNPAGISPAMDVAKMEAMDALAREMAGPGVTVLRECRAGLFSLPPDPNRALGQLASATRTAMALRPDILHVVGHTEADHAIEPHELVASCAMVHQVIDDALLGIPDPLADPAVVARRDHLVEEAGFLLSVIRDRWPEAFEGDGEALAAVVRSGVFDAPYLAGNPAARGEVITVVEGGCDAVDPDTGQVVSERERLARLGLA
jgi:methylmalonyl-CoA mutase cobalamin-binding subunit